MRRLAPAAVLVALIALPASEAQGAGVHCGVPVVGNSAVLKKNLICAGNGIVVGEVQQRIDLNGHTITGDGTGIGIDFRGIPARITGGKVRNFDTGIAMAGGRERLSSVRVEFTTSDGIRVYSSSRPGGGAVVDVTVSNAGGNGVSVYGPGDGPVKRGSTLFPAEPFFSGLNVFSSAASGISIDGNTKTTVEKSVAKQNGGDGIFVNPFAGSDGANVEIHNSRADYNVGWGINGLRGVLSLKNTAVGNGQVRQCRIVECN